MLPGPLLMTMSPTAPLNRDADGELAARARFDGVASVLESPRHEAIEPGRFLDIIELAVLEVERHVEQCDGALSACRPRRH